MAVSSFLATSASEMLFASSSFNHSGGSPCKPLEPSNETWTLCDISKGSPTAGFSGLSGAELFLSFSAVFLRKLVMFLKEERSRNQEMVFCLLNRVSISVCLCDCLCDCACVIVRVSVLCVRVWACVRGRACVSVRVCVKVNPHNSEEGERK